MYLAEAFKALNALNEDTFSLTDDGINKLSEFEQNDDLADEISVIDPEAETEDDLQDSYVGKVILDCSVCHSKLYKDKSEVTVDDEQQLANVGEECPYCYTSDGFKVIGEVAAFNDEESEKESAEEEPVEDESKDDSKEDLEEGLFNFGYKKRKKEADRRNKEMQARLKKEYDAKAKKATADWEEEQARSNARSREVQRGLDNYDRARSNKSNGSKVSNTGKAGVYYSGGDYYSEDLDEGIFTKKKSKELWTVGYRDNSGKFKAVSVQGSKEDAITERNQLEKSNPKFKYVIVSGNKKDESLQEDVNNVNVETDDSIVNIETGENGKVVVSTEPKNDLGNGDEMLAPLSDETENEILNNDSESEEFSEEGMETEEGSEEDVDIEEFDEESFDELGESYLKNIYENVNSYKTTKVSTRANKLKVEGIIKFNSGNTKKTSFVFESKDINTKGKVSFIGENLNITRGKKAFTVKGEVNKGKFISESLNYNYRTKDDTGKSTRIYGTVKKRG